MNYTKKLREQQNIKEAPKHRKIINVQRPVLVSVTCGYIKLTLLLIVIFFRILYLRKVILVYSNKWRTESGSHIELAGRFPPLPVQQ